MKFFGRVAGYTLFDGKRKEEWPVKRTLDGAKQVCQGLTGDGWRCTVMITSRSILMIMWNVSDRSCTENPNTYFTSITFFQKSWLLWSNVKKYGRDGQATEGNTTRRMRFACWINNPTDSHSECVKLTAFPRQQWLGESQPMFCLYLVVRIVTSVLPNNYDPVWPRGWVELQLYSSMTATLEGAELSAARPGRTLPSGKTRYPFYRRLGGPQGRSGWTENLVPTGIRSRTVLPVVSRYTDWATAAHT